MQVKKPKTIFELFIKQKIEFKFVLLSMVHTLFIKKKNDDINIPTLELEP